MSQSIDDGAIHRGAAEAAFGKYLNYSRRLLQPLYWPELRRIAARKISRHQLAPARIAQARNVSFEIAVDIASALRALGFAAAPRSLAADDRRRFAAAGRRVAALREPQMGDPADVDLLYSLCHASGARRIVETGVAFGWSTFALLAGIENRAGARLVSVDLPDPGARLDNHIGLAVPNELMVGWKFIRGADREMLPAALAEMRTVDFAHYDSDRSQAGRRFAYPLLWRALAPGGLLVSSDVGADPSFLEFARAVRVMPVIVRRRGTRKLSGILRKRI